MTTAHVPESKPVRRLTMIPQGLTIIVTSFLPIFAIVSMFPAVPALIAHFASDPDARWKVPLAIAAPGLSIAIVAPFAGLFVDRMGRRRLLIGSTLLYGILGVLPFFLVSLDALFLARLLLGLAEAAIFTTAGTLIGDYWDDHGRRTWLFLQGILGPMLSAVAIGMAGPATAYRWNSIFLVYAIAFPVCLAVFAFLHEPAKAAAVSGAEAPTKVVRTAYPMRTIVWIAAVTLFSSALYYVLIISGGLAFGEIGINSPEQISRVSTIPSLFVILGAVIFWLLGNRSSAIQIFVFFLLLCGGLIGIGLAHDWRWLVAALIVQQTGAGMAAPVLIAWAQRLLPPEHRGSGMGVWTAAFFFGQFSSPWITHQFENWLGSMQHAFLAMGTVGVIGGAAALLGSLRSPQQGGEPRS